MSKKSVFTTITELPAGLSRETVIDTLHCHTEMIDLNPLVIARSPLPKAPAHATAEEFHCTWYSITDTIQYLPGGLAKGNVTYTGCFHDLPTGLQTHVYAPMGLDIRSKWTLGGTLPGEPIQPVEIGLGAPMQGLYLREDVEMKCNVMLTSFVKKTLKKSHALLVDRMMAKAHIVVGQEHNARLSAMQERNMRTANYVDSQSSMTYADSSADSESNYEGSADRNYLGQGSGSPGYAQQIASPPTTPGYSYLPDPALASQGRNIRASTSSLPNLAKDGRNSYGPPNGAHGQNHPRIVSWQNLNATRQSPGMGYDGGNVVDPAYRPANHYVEAPRPQSYQAPPPQGLAVELASEPRNVNSVVPDLTLPSNRSSVPYGVHEMAG
ncbi:hypothetical protein BP5796_01529 [Coleophoma crateriformis]|uniref:DUF7053 domain-containing protein n=1 Tax=Coleophoma crateriformis TaxID=565419 RepID=A0A3D8T0N7_9HELO|nr:hypothetical protein BP5796_01529 [Coleophoma crateriformis]